MAYPTITDLPSAPQRTQTPDAFSTTADAFVAALPTLVTEVNAAGDYIDTKTISVGNDFQGTYSAGTTYTTGQSVLYSSKFYLSLVDSNTGNTPDSSPSQWVEIAGSAGGGGGTVDFTASGAISNGDLVKINSDGTVSVSEGGGVGSAEVFESARSDTPSAVFDSSNNKVVVVYDDDGNSGYGTAVVGTVSGSSISFGTPVVFVTNAASEFAPVFDNSSNKVVICYKDGTTDYPSAVVGTVSGTSISFGSAASAASAIVSNVGATFDSNSNKVVICYRDSNNSNYGTAAVGTVSGTSISFGTPVVYISALANFNRATFDSSNNKVVVAYRNFTSGNGEAIVGTVSGTSISFGSEATFHTGTTTAVYTTFDSNSNKVVISYYDSTDDGNAVVGTVSGTSISFGTPVDFSSPNNVREPRITFDSNKNLIYIFYKDDTLSDHYVATGEVSGTTITFIGDAVLVSGSSASDAGQITFDSNANKAVLVYKDQTNNDYGTAVTYVLSDSGSWVGIATSAISDSATGTITVVSGVNESQTGLTTGSKYYFSADGTLTTTAVSGREVGRAIAADKILITQGSIS